MIKNRKTRQLEDGKVIGEYPDSKSTYSERLMIENKRQEQYRKNAIKKSGDLRIIQLIKQGLRKPIAIRSIVKKEYPEYPEGYLTDKSIERLIKMYGAKEKIVDEDFEDR